MRYEREDKKFDEFLQSGEKDFLRSSDNYICLSVWIRKKRNFYNCVYNLQSKTQLVTSALFFYYNTQLVSNNVV